MTTPARPFDDLAANILHRYVRSVLIIDDQWFDGPLDSDAERGATNESNAVREEEDPDLEMDETDGRSAEAALPAVPDYDLELLDIKEAVQGEGILFSGLRYESRAQFDQALKLAERADIVILDWELLRDDGA